MGELVHIENTDIVIKEYKGQRVVTFKDIDRVHERPNGTARRNFSTNKEHFIENEDFFIVTPSDIKEFGMYENRPIGIETVNNRGTIFLTEQGYLMLVKSFTDDLAWKVQRQLVSSYFRVRQKTDRVENIMVAEIGKKMLELMEQQQNLIRSMNVRIENLERKDAIKTAYIEEVPKVPVHRKNQSWICVKEQVLETQSRVLAKQLRCSQNEAVGLLVRLWLWAVDNVDDTGYMKAVSKDDVADILSIGKQDSYDGMEAVEALISSNWIELEDGLTLLDWAYWQDMVLKYIKNKRNDKERKRAERTRKYQLNNY